MKKGNGIAYEEGETLIKGVRVGWKLVDASAEFPNTNGEKGAPSLHERFLFVISAGGKTYKFDFYNSVMERGITALIGEQRKMQSVKQTREAISRRFSWGGYSKCASYAQLEAKRVFYLVYGALNSNASDVMTDTGSFSEFCLGLGYDTDSRSAEKIFNAIREAKNKWDEFAPALDAPQRAFFEMNASQEDDEFSEEVKNAVKARGD
jgi:hypothetical protein